MYEYALTVKIQSLQVLNTRLLNDEYVSIFGKGHQTSVTNGVEYAQLEC